MADLGNRLQQFFSDLDLIVEDIVITSHHGHMEAQPFVASCPTGSMEMDRTCGELNYNDMQDVQGNEGIIYMSL